MSQETAQPKRKFPVLLVASGLSSVVALVVLVLFVGPHISWMFGGMLEKKGRAPAHEHEIETEGDEEEETAAEDHSPAPAHHESQQHAHQSHGKVAGLFRTYADAITSVQDKVDTLRKVEHTNQELQLENLRLRALVEGMRFDCRLKEASVHNGSQRLKLRTETGSIVGRTLASIDYAIPEHLLPAQLHTLGVTYFKKGEDEKAAKIFTQLVEMEEIATYRTAKDYLLTGVSWYRLDNYKLADDYFAKALKIESTPDTRPYLAQARLWRALVSEKLGKHVKSQFWMRELVDHHPHSTESKWVNRPAENQLSERARKALEKTAHGGETQREPATKHHE